jgi:hypothetical protein
MDEQRPPDDPGGPLPGSDDPSPRHQPSLQRPKGTVWLVMTLLFGALCLPFLIGLGLGGEPQRTGALIVAAVMIAAVLIHRRVSPGPVRIRLLLTTTLLVPVAFAVIVVAITSEL